MHRKHLKNSPPHWWAGRLKMKHIRKIIELKELTDLSVRAIRNALSLPRSTVNDYLTAYKASDLTLDLIQTLNDDQIYTALFGEKPKGSSRPLPDFSKMNTELKKKHVTRSLLWEEYREQHSEGLGYSQFCDHYRLWSKKVSISMRQVHKAGEKMFVDYSGLTMEVTNPKTGEISKAEVFVAALGASGYSYAEASSSQKKHDFVASHVRAFKFFGGVTEVLVPDYVPWHIIWFMWPSSLCCLYVRSIILSGRNFNKWEHNIHRDCSHLSKFESSLHTGFRGYSRETPKSGSQVRSASTFMRRVISA
jgi:hypothetical protein